MYPDMFVYGADWSFLMPLRLRTWFEHLFRSRFTPKNELRQLRRFLLVAAHSGTKPQFDVLLYHVIDPLGEEEILVFCGGSLVEIHQETRVMEPDGRVVVVSTIYTITSFRRPVLRKVTCELADSEDAVDVAECGVAKLRRFPVGLVYADATDLRELLHKLSSWERADA